MHGGLVSGISCSRPEPGGWSRRIDVGAPAIPGQPLWLHETLSSPNEAAWPALLLVLLGRGHTENVLLLSWA